MHNTVKNLIYIEERIKSKINDLSSHKMPKIVAVSKTFGMEKILPLLTYGHTDYGENKIQEALDKWMAVKEKNESIKLHLIGKLQSNKVKFAVKIFDYIHSLDTEKLANKLAEEQIKQNKKIKLFIQVNIGNEEQKSGVKKENIYDFYKYCKNLNLDIVGTMCIPPKDVSSQDYFLEMKKINKELDLTDLSMGMSNDYLEAAQNNATFLRIGSKIFGERD